MKNKVKIIALTIFSSFYINVLAQKKDDVGSIADSSFVFNTKSNDRIALPFGYKNVEQENLIDSALLNINKFQNSAFDLENKIKKLDFTAFLKKNSVFLKEDYYSSQQLDKNSNLYSLNISSKYLAINDIKIYFISLEHLGNRVYMLTVKDNKIVDIKWVYLHYSGEMGYSYYKFFELNKDKILSIRNYEFTEDPIKNNLLEQFKITDKGKFIRYYPKNGNFINIEEQGIVKNNKRQGLWIETQLNYNLDLSNYNEFSDKFTYSVLNYESGLPQGQGKFYKLIQSYDKNGNAILSTRKKGKLIYTETYKNGEMKERKFVN